MENHNLSFHFGQTATFGQDMYIWERLAFTSRSLARHEVALGVHGSLHGASTGWSWLGQGGHWHRKGGKPLPGLLHQDLSSVLSSLTHTEQGLHAMFGT